MKRLLFVVFVFVVSVFGLAVLPPDQGLTPIGEGFQSMLKSIENQCLSGLVGSALFCALQYEQKQNQVIGSLVTAQSGDRHAVRLLKELAVESDKLTSELAYLIDDCDRLPDTFELDAAALTAVITSVEATQVEFETLDALSARFLPEGLEAGLLVVSDADASDDHDSKLLDEEPIYYDYLFSFEGGQKQADLVLITLHSDGLVDRVPFLELLKSTGLSKASVYQHFAVKPARLAQKLDGFRFQSTADHPIEAFKALING